MWKVKLSIKSPMKWMNAYLIQGTEGHTIIDPGMDTEQNRSLWLEIIRSAGGPSHIKQIVVTHHHADHYGLAGWLQKLTGAEVWASEPCIQQAEFIWLNKERYSDRLFDWMREYGVKGELLESFRHDHNEYLHSVKMHPSRFELLTEGQLIRIGDRNCKVIASPGHAMGHMSLLDEHNQILFCGDQILPQIPPNLSYFVGFDQNPLEDLIQSIERQGQLNVQTALPGHFNPFGRFHKRGKEIIGYHLNRLELLRDGIHSGLSGLEMTRRLNPRIEIKGATIKFLLMEIEVYLQYLRRLDDKPQHRSVE